MKHTRIFLAGVVAGVCLLITGSLFGALVSTSHTFQSGAVISAGDVNENFTELADELNKRDIRIYTSTAAGVAIPDGVTRAMVEVIGGGGGGAAGGYYAGQVAGASGGGGGYAKGILTLDDSTDTLNIDIGSGGSGGSGSAAGQCDGANGGAGTYSKVTRVISGVPSATEYVRADGGSGGTVVVRLPNCTMTNGSGGGGRGGFLVTQGLAASTPASGAPGEGGLGGTGDANTAHSAGYDGQAGVVILTFY